MSSYLRVSLIEGQKRKDQCPQSQHSTKHHHNQDLDVNTCRKNNNNRKCCHGNSHSDHVDFSVVFSRSVRSERSVGDGFRCGGRYYNLTDGLEGRRGERGKKVKPIWLGVAMTKSLN